MSLAAGGNTPYMGSKSFAAYPPSLSGTGRWYYSAKIVEAF